MIPRGDTRILAGDSLILIVSEQDKEAAFHQLAG
jgi:Trk K+ transport system NAD-binding subunit